jgi:hypothetical protein
VIEKKAKCHTFFDFFFSSRWYVLYLSSSMFFVNDTTPWSVRFVNVGDMTTNSLIHQDVGIRINTGKHLFHTVRCFSSNCWCSEMIYCKVDYAIPQEWLVLIWRYECVETQDVVTSSIAFPEKNGRIQTVAGLICSWFVSGIQGYLSIIIDFENPKNTLLLLFKQRNGRDYFISWKSAA